MVILSIRTTADYYV